MTDQRTEAILGRLAALSSEADLRKASYWEVKDELDAFLREVMAMPKRERPTGDQLGEAMGRDRRRLYQILKIANKVKTGDESIPR